MHVCLRQPLVDAQSYGSAEVCHLLKQYGGATSEVSENVMQLAAFLLCYVTHSGCLKNVGSTNDDSYLLLVREEHLHFIV